MAFGNLRLARFVHSKKRNGMDFVRNQDADGAGDARKWGKSNLLVKKFVRKHQTE